MTSHIFGYTVIVFGLLSGVTFSSSGGDTKASWDSKQVTFSDDVDEGIAHPKMSSEGGEEEDYEGGLQPYDRSTYEKRGVLDSSESEGEEEDEALTQRLRDAAGNTSLNETLGEREEDFRAESKAEKAKKNEEEAKQRAAEQRELNRRMAQQMKDNPDPERDESEWE